VTPPDEPADADGAARPAPASAVSSDRWRAIQRVVDGALDLPPAARAAYLDTACGSDSALREDTTRLLDACERAERADGLLAAPAVAFAAPMLADLALHDAARAEERRGSLADALRSVLSGRYVIERELGRGGMATVYLARDVRHDRAVAVKVVERNVAPTGAERFSREIRTAARLTHPHVLGVHDSGEADGLLYYVMPYVEGETLRARLAREGALPLADAVRLVRELTDALSYAHGRGVMHRDLKPENVLISGGHAVVADFGIAKAIAAATNDGSARGVGLTSAGVALGTPAYMAPEQAVGDAATDHRADLYALGVIAYEALTGTHPFGARSAQAFVAAHLTEPPPPLGHKRADTPPALSALVMRLLAKDPAARPQSATAVLQLLNDAPATPTGRPPKARRSTLVAFAVLFLAAGMGGYVMWRRNATSDSDSRSLSARYGAVAATGAVPIRTVAVLPFENTGGTAADDYFSDGMTDELAHALARIPGLQLPGRTSTYTFKGKAAAAQEIGRVLDVQALVSGTVRRGGDRLRVATQLVSTSNGKVLWDSVYESRSSDVFAVQDEFTRAIVMAIAPALGSRTANGLPPDAARGTTDQEAYDLYLKGRYFWLNRDAANNTQAIAYFRQAVARDPAFARAHAGLALAYATLSVYVAGAIDSTMALQTASARRAIALDSTLADAQVALGLALELRLKFRDAKARYRAALALEPSNVMAHHALGFVHLITGRTDEAVVELRQASQLDPLAKSAGSAFAYALFFARRFRESEAASRRTLTIDSTFTLAISGLGFAQMFGGQPDSAVRTLERGMQLHPNSPGLRAPLLFAYAAAGRWADAERIRAQLRRPGGDASGGGDAAFAELVFGDREPLVRLLMTENGQRRWYESRGFGCFPLLDPLWADERFRATMRDLAVEPCPLARPWPLPPRPRDRPAR
jgi:serine/threonine protein kinase/TolB-like protein